MTENILETIGLTKEEMADRVAERIANSLIEERIFADALRKKVEGLVGESIEKIALQHVAPDFPALVETMLLQNTNRWGESKGAPLTFREYLTEKAEEFLREPVDMDGKTKRDGGSFYGATTSRVMYMIHKHLHHEIGRTIEACMKDANSQLVAGLQQGIKIKLEQLLSSLKIKTEVGR